MFDGAGIATLSTVVTDPSGEQLPSPDDASTENAPADAAPTGEPQFSSRDQALVDALDANDAAQARQEIVFLSPSVRNYQHLLDGISPNVEVIILDPARDGVQQMAEVLTGRTGIDAIHLIGEGTEAEMHLGTSFLTQESISTRYAELFQQIGQNLSSDADVLIYGCNFGRGAAGQAAIQTLATLTGADVAASTDRTGHASEFANWNLEVWTGSIESSVVIGTATQEAWEGVLATYTVTTTTDGGAGSLRQAILNANANAGTDTITFVGNGTYLLTIAGTGENAAATGDLDITGNLIIIGNGVGNTIIDGGGIDRVFEVRGGVVVDFENMTIRGGSAPTWGGGLYVSDSGNNVRLTDVMFTSNAADSGGGIYNIQSTLTATDSIIDGNMATSWGAGLYNDRGTVDLNRVTVSNNSASKEGGGIYNFGAGAALSLTNVTISGNFSGTSGGGIYTNRSVPIINSTIAFNTSGGGFFGQGGQGTATVKNTILANNIGGNANKSLTSAGGNIDSDGTAGLGLPTDLNGVDPLLVGLADNGGATKTHALLAGSPAINAGLVKDAPGVDQRGFHRTDGHPDIGAVEYQAVLLDKIYWVDQTNNKIQRANLDGSNIEDVLTGADGVNSPTEILIDAVGGKMYWSEYFSGNIKRANLDGTNIETLYSGLNSPDGMALDLANNMLYWIENPFFGGPNQIRRADMDGGGPITNLITSGTNDPWDMQLDLEKGKIYWTDANAGEIRRADLNGSNAGVFISGLTNPQGLVLDLGAQMIYWVSDGAVTDKIQRANLEGPIVIEDLVTSLLDKPTRIDLDLAAGKMYWTDWGLDAIKRANLDGSNIENIVNSGLNLPVGIALGTATTNTAPSVDLDVDNSSGATGNDYAITFTEGGVPTAIADSDTDLVDADSTTFAYVQLSVTGLLDGNSEMLILDGSTFGLATAIAGQDTTGGNYHVVLSTGAGTATVNVTKQGGGNYTEAEVETLIKAVQYQHTDTSVPTDGNRLIDALVNDGTANSAAARTTINVNPVNDQPTFSGLDNTPTFMVGGGAVVLDSNATMADSELDAINNYNGATLTLVRNGGANGDDLFDGSGTMNTLTQGGNVVVSGTTIGTVTTNSGGTLVLTFNGNATTARVNSALQQLTYANSNGTPPTNVQIDFTIDDGNAGVQGSGGALSGAGSITVTINATNTAPTVDLDANNSSGATGNDYAVTFAEGSGPIGIADSDTDLVDVDSTTFASVKLTISGLLDGNAETLLLDGDTFALATAVAGQDTTGGNYRVVITTGAGTATITITKQGGGNFSEVETETLIKAVQYQHTDTNAPTDGNRLIDVIVNDGTADSAAARTTINVNPVNDAPVITSNGGGPTANVTVPENVTVVTTVTSSDVDGGTAVYSIVPVGSGGGVDAASFTIDSSTGVLSSLAAPDYEAPTDVGADNVYDVTVQVSDGNGGTTIQALSIMVTDVVEALPPTLPPPAIPPSLVPQPPTTPPVGEPPAAGSPPLLPPIVIRTPVDPEPTSDSPVAPFVPGSAPGSAPPPPSEMKGAQTPKGMNPAEHSVQLSHNRGGYVEEGVAPRMHRADEPVSRPFGRETLEKAQTMLSEAFRQSLRIVEEDLRRATDMSESNLKFSVGVTNVGGVGLTAGVITWLLRSGALLASLAASLPAWRHFDPLPVVLTSDRTRRRSTADTVVAADRENKQFRGLRDLLDRKGHNGRSEGEGGET